MDEFVKKLINILFFGILKPILLVNGWLTLIVLIVFFSIVIWRLARTYKERKAQALLDKQKLDEWYKKQSEKNVETIGDIKPSESDEEQKIPTLPWEFVSWDRPINWNSFSEVKKVASELNFDEIAYWHDQTDHSVFMKVHSGTAYRFGGKDNRNNSDRQKLNPLIAPRDNEGFDRTHLIPIGLIGTERDNRMLVGFDSALNRGPLNDWETAAKKYVNQNGGYWLTWLKHLPNGSIQWIYRLYSLEMQPISQKKVQSDRIYNWEVEQ